MSEVICNIEPKCKYLGEEHSEASPIITRYTCKLHSDTLLVPDKEGYIEKLYNCEGKVQEV